MSTVNTLISTFRVGYRYRCTVSLDLANLEVGGPFVLTCQWTPRPPKKLSERETADYRRARDALLGELARLNNWNVLLAEVGTGKMDVIEPSTEAPRCSN
jgi:hypothetical protein